MGAQSFQPKQITGDLRKEGVPLCLPGQNPESGLLFVLENNLS